MAQPLRFQARRRTILGKKVRQLRRQGIMPAVVYGPEIESVPIELDTHVVETRLTRVQRTTPIELVLDGEPPRTVLVEEIEIHPRTQRIAHVTFFQLPRARPIHVDVPVRFVGEAPGVKQGGSLVHPLDAIPVECLPKDLPEFIDVDISRLEEVGDVLHVRDLTPPPGVTFRTDPDVVVATIVLPTAAREELEAAEQPAAPTEPAPAPAEEAEAE